MEFLSFLKKESIKIYLALFFIVFANFHCFAMKNKFGDFSLLDKRYAKEMRHQERINSRLKMIEMRGFLLRDRGKAIKQRNEFEKFFKEDIAPLRESGINLSSKKSDLERTKKEKEALIEKYKKANEAENKKCIEFLDQIRAKSNGADSSETIKKYLEDLKKHSEEHEVSLAQLEREKEFIDELCEAIDKGETNKISSIVSRVESELGYFDKDLKMIEAELGGFKGDIIFRGIAGKDWEMVEDLKVGDDIWEGFKNGIMLRGSLSVGNAIGSSIDDYIKRMFSGTLGKFEDFLSFLYRLVFHSSCRPFTVEEINYWKSLIVKDIDEVRLMVEKAEKIDSRGKADILREYENENSPKETLNLWQDFVSDLALTCEELAQEIDLRKGYYQSKEIGFNVVNCADRLKNKLLKVRNWLLSARSLKEFANISEVKSLIPSMKKSLENYFVNLADQVKPVGSKRNLSGGSSLSSSKWQSDSHSSDYQNEDPYPSYMK